MRLSIVQLFGFGLCSLLPFLLFASFLLFFEWRSLLEWPPYGINGKQHHKFGRFDLYVAEVSICKCIASERFLCALASVATFVRDGLGFFSAHIQYSIKFSRRQNSVESRELKVYTVQADAIPRRHSFISKYVFFLCGRIMNFGNSLE